MSLTRRITDLVDEAGDDIVLALPACAYTALAQEIGECRRYSGPARNETIAEYLVRIDHAARVLPVSIRVHGHQGVAQITRMR